MKIEYAGGSNLYILATQLDVIQKYADADAKRPKLNKLGTQEWGQDKGQSPGSGKGYCQRPGGTLCSAPAEGGLCLRGGHGMAERV